jgi:hypothetical protein
MGLTKTLMVAGVGAALAYFLDPVSGRERRRKLREYWDDRMQGLGQPIEADEPGPAVVVDSQQGPRPAE